MSVKEYIKKTPLYPFASAVNKTMKGFLSAPKKISNIVFPKTIVLLYHRVYDLDNDPESLAISPKLFEEQLVFLKNNYVFLTLEDFYKSLENKKIIKKGILITFDDGYRDNFTNALPILQKHKIPTVIFITGNETTISEFWWDELANIFQYTEDMPKQLALIIEGINVSFDTSNIEKAGNVYKKMHRLLKPMPFQKREMILKKLYSWRGIRRTIRDAYARCSPDELNSMASTKLISLGAHTQYHCQLSLLSYEDQRNDIEKNSLFIKNIEKKSPFSFSYPFGSRNDYNGDSIKIAKKNFDLAFSNFKGQITARTDKYQIPRFVVKNWNAEEFTKKIKSFFLSP